MSLRARMGLAAGVAVALAVIAVAFTSYAGTSSELQGQVDQSLRSLAHPLLIRAGVIKAPRQPVGGPDLSAPSGGVAGAQGGGAGVFGRPSATRNDCDDGLGLDYTRGGPFGSARGDVQLVDPRGSICLAAGESRRIPVDARVRALARSGRGNYLANADVGSSHLRVLVYGVGSRGALEVALRNNDVEDALHSQLLLLALIAAGGIALAALLGLLVARTALAPIGRFTRQTEAIADSPDRLEQDRLDVHGGDELARLAQTFNRTLDALASSVQAQRNLVADASHELRTPIATIRANLQLMRDEELLSEEDRQALRADVIEELDELTALVGDVVELARGSKQSGERGDVRVDAIVTAAVERTRRRAPELTVRETVERPCSTARVIGSPARSRTCSTTPRSGARAGERSRFPSRRASSPSATTGRLPRRGPAVRVRPLSPGSGRALEAGLGPRARYRSPGGRGPRWLCKGGERRRRRGADADRVRSHASVRRAGAASVQLLDLVSRRAAGEQRLERWRAGARRPTKPRQPE